MALLFERCPSATHESKGINDNIMSCKRLEMRLQEL
jgi:hypothetical protein